MSDTVSQDTREIIIVETQQVACSGGDGSLGHPMVWYQLGPDGRVSCKYCDRQFVLKGSKYDR